jgi:excisionase family DNA binding protein
MPAKRYECALPWCSSPEGPICPKCRGRIEEIRQELGLERERLSTAILELLWSRRQETLLLAEISRATGVSRGELAAHRRQLGAKAPKHGVDRPTAIALVRGAVLADQAPTLHQFAEDRGVGVETLLRRAKRGQLIVWKRGHRLYVPLAEAEKIPSRGGVSTPEVARRLGVTYDTVGGWIRDGLIKGEISWGGHYRIPETEVVRLERLSGWLTTDRAAQRLKVTRSHLRELCTAGKLAFERFGRELRLDPEAVERYRAEHLPPAGTLSPAEFAKKVGLSRLPIVRRCREGEIRCVMWRGQYRIPVSELRRYRAWIPLLEAAEESGIAYLNLRQLAHTGRLIHRRQGGRLFITGKVLRELIWQKENLISAEEFGRIVGITEAQAKKLASEKRVATFKNPLVGRGTFLRSEAERARRIIASQRENLVTSDEYARLAGLGRIAVQQLGRAGLIRVVDPWVGEASYHRGLALTIRRQLAWQDRDLLSATALSEATGIRLSRVRELQDAGEIPTYRLLLSGDRVFHRSSMRKLRRRVAWERANLLTAPEFGKALGLSNGQIYRLIREDLIERIDRPLAGKGTLKRSSLEVVRAMIKRGEITPTRSLSPAA